MDDDDATVASGPRAVEERDGAGPLREHPGWAEAFPWLVQGVTARGDVEAPFDLALFGRGGTLEVLDRWTVLMDATDMERAVHGRQVHGACVRLHGEGPPGLLVVPACDGHATATPGLLVTVATADCVPISVVAPERRAVALLHAGWRGAAAGILEAGLDTLSGRLRVAPDEVHVHLGPAICGSCYEVGPEVFEALGLPAPGAPTPVDLRGALAERAAAAGVRPERVSVSSRCTRCGDGSHFSHRGGDAGRQLTVLGVRA